MKIAYILPSLKDSGITRIPFFLAEHLKTNNFVKVFYFSETTQPTLNFSVPVEQISLSNFCQALNDFDIIHPHGLRPDLYVMLNCQKIKSIKITTIHGYHYEELKYIYDFFRAFLAAQVWTFSASQFDAAVCISKIMEKYYIEKNLRNTTVIYNGIPLESSNEQQVKPCKTHENITLCTVSNLGRRKGVEQIIKLLKLGQEYQLIAVGADSEKNVKILENQANKLGVLDRCVFQGFSNNPFEKIINSDIFVFPSRSEGFGLALVEAANLGIPILCSDIPTFREIFTEDEVTFFELDNIADIHNKVTGMLKNREETHSKALRAKKKVKNLFSLEKMCSQYHDLYSGLLQSRLSDPSRV